MDRVSLENRETPLSRQKEEIYTVPYPNTLIPSFSPLDGCALGLGMAEISCPSCPSFVASNFVQAVAPEARPRKAIPRICPTFLPLLPSVFLACSTLFLAALAASTSAEIIGCRPVPASQHSKNQPVAALRNREPLGVRDRSGPCRRYQRGIPLEVSVVCPLLFLLSLLSLLSLL